MSLADNPLAILAETVYLEVFQSQKHLQTSNISKNLTTKPTSKACKSSASPKGVCNSRSSDSGKSSSGSPILLDYSFDSGIAGVLRDGNDMQLHNRIQQCQFILLAIERDQEYFSTIRNRLSKITKTKQIHSSENENELFCNVCCAEIDSSDEKTYVKCYICKKIICRNDKCADWLPKTAEWECELCQTSKESLAQTSSWVAEQITFNQEKIIRPPRARSEIYIPISEYNDSLIHFESVSQIGANSTTITAEQKFKIREYVEQIVAKLLGGNLDTIAVNQLSKSENCLPDPKVEKINNGTSQESLAVRAKDFSEISETRLRQMIQKVIAETLSLPPLTNGHAKSGIALDGPGRTCDNKTLKSNGYYQGHRTEHYFEPTIYQDLLATAILNKIVDKQLNRNRNVPERNNSSGGGGNDDINDNIKLANPDQNFNVEKLSTSSGSSVEPQSDCSYPEVEQILNNNGDKSSELLRNSDRDSVMSDYLANHMIPLPDLSATATESEDDDYTSVTSSAVGDGTWEKNWLFKKKKSTLSSSVTASSVGMLVPDPKEDVRAQIGDKTADEVSDLSELGSDSDDSLNSLRSQLEPINDRLINKHLIGGQNSKLILDELIERSSVISNCTLPTVAEPIYADACNEHIIEAATKNEAINDNVNQPDVNSNSLKASDDNSESDGCTGFSNIEIIESTSRRPSVVEILAAMALGPMLAIPSTDQPITMSVSEFTAFTELKELALEEIKNRSLELTSSNLDVIPEESGDVINLTENDINSTTEQMGFNLQESDKCFLPILLQEKTESEATANLKTSEVLPLFSASCQQLLSDIPTETEEILTTKVEETPSNEIGENSDNNSTKFLSDETNVDIDQNTVEEKSEEKKSCEVQIATEQLSATKPYDMPDSEIPEIISEEQNSIKQPDILDSDNNQAILESETHDKIDEFFKESNEINSNVDSSKIQPEKSYVFSEHLSLNVELQEVLGSTSSVRLESNVQASSTDEHPSVEETEKISNVPTDRNEIISIEKSSDAKKEVDNEQTKTEDITLEEQSRASNKQSNSTNCANKEESNSEKNTSDEFSRKPGEIISIEAHLEIQTEQIEVVPEENSDSIHNKDIEQFKTKENILDEHSKGLDEAISKGEFLETLNQIELICHKQLHLSNNAANEQYNAEHTIEHTQSNDLFISKELPSETKIDQIKNISLIHVETTNNSAETEENILEEHLSGLDTTIMQEQSSETQTNKIDLVLCLNSYSTNQAGNEVSKELSSQILTEENGKIETFDDYSRVSDTEISEQQSPETQGEQIDIDSKEHSHEEASKEQCKPEIEHSEVVPNEHSDLNKKTAIENIKSEEKTLIIDKSGLRDQTSTKESKTLESTLTEPSREPDEKISDIDATDNVANENFKTDAHIHKEDSTEDDETILKKKLSETQTKQFEIVIISQTETDQITADNTANEQLKNEESSLDEYLDGVSQIISQEQSSGTHSGQLQTVPNEQPTELIIHNVTVECTVDNEQLKTEADTLSEPDEIIFKEEPSGIMYNADKNYSKTEAETPAVYSKALDETNSKEQPSETLSQPIVCNKEQTSETQTEQIETLSNEGNIAPIEPIQIVSNDQLDHRNNAAKKQSKTQDNILNEHATGIKALPQQNSTVSDKKSDFSNETKDNSDHSGDLDKTLSKELSLITQTNPTDKKYNDHTNSTSKTENVQYKIEENICDKCSKSPDKNIINEQHNKTQTEIEDVTLEQLLSLNKTAFEKLETQTKTLEEYCRELDEFIIETDQIKKNSEKYFNSASNTSYEETKTEENTCNEHSKELCKTICKEQQPKIQTEQLRTDQPLEQTIVQREVDEVHFKQTTYGTHNKHSDVTSNAKNEQTKIGVNIPDEFSSTSDDILFITQLSETHTEQTETVSVEYTNVIAANPKLETGENTTADGSKGHDEIMPKVQNSATKIEQEEDAIDEELKILGEKLKEPGISNNTANGDCTNEEDSLNSHSTEASEIIPKEKHSDAQTEQIELLSNITETRNEQFEIVSSEESPEVIVDNTSESANISAYEQIKSEEVILNVVIKHSKNKEDLLDDNAAGISQTISKEQPSKTQNEEIEGVTSEEAAEGNFQNISDTDNISINEQHETDEVILKGATEHSKNEEDSAESSQSISEEQPHKTLNDQAETVLSERDSLDEHSAGVNEKISTEEPSETQNEHNAVVPREEKEQVITENISSFDHISANNQLETEEFILNIDAEHSKNKEDILDDQFEGSIQTISKDQPSEAQNEQTETDSNYQSTRNESFEDLENTLLDEIISQTQSEKTVSNNPPNEHPKEEEETSDEKLTGVSQTIFNEQPLDIQNEQIEAVLSKETAEVNIQNISNFDHISDNERIKNKEVILNVVIQHSKEEEDTLYERSAGSSQKISKIQPTETQNAQKETVTNEQPSDSIIQKKSDSMNIEATKSLETEENMAHDDRISNPQPCKPQSVQIVTQNYKEEGDSLDEHSVGVKQTIFTGQPSETQNEQFEVVPREEVEQLQTEQVILNIDTEHSKNKENILHEQLAGSNQTPLKQQPSEAQNEQTKTVANNQSTGNESFEAVENTVLDKLISHTQSEKTENSNEHSKEEEETLAEKLTGVSQTISHEQPFDIQNEQIEAFPIEETVEINIQNMSHSDHISVKEQHETEDDILKVDTTHFKNEENTLDEHAAVSNQTISKDQPSGAQNEQIEVVPSEQETEVNSHTISDSDHISVKEQNEEKETVPNEHSTELVNHNKSDSTKIEATENLGTEENTVLDEIISNMQPFKLQSETSAGFSQTISTEQPYETQNEQIEFVPREEAAQVNIQDISNFNHISANEQLSTEDIILNIDAEHSTNKEDILDEQLAGSSHTISREELSEAQNEQTETISNYQSTGNESFEDVDNRDLVDLNSQTQSKQTVNNLPKEHPKEEESSSEKLTEDSHTISIEQPCETQNEVARNETPAEVNIQTKFYSKDIAANDDITLKVVTKVSKNEKDALDEHSAEVIQTIFKAQLSEAQNEQKEMVKSTELTELIIYNKSDSTNVENSESLETKDNSIKECLTVSDEIISEEQAVKTQSEQIVIKSENDGKLTISNEQSSQTEKEIVLNEEPAEVNNQNISHINHIAANEQLNTEEVALKAVTEYSENEIDNFDEHTTESSQTIFKEQHSDTQNEQKETVINEEASELVNNKLEFTNVETTESVETEENTVIDEIIVNAQSLKTLSKQIASHISPTKYPKDEEDSLDEHSAGVGQTISEEQPFETQNEENKVLPAGDVNIQNMSNSDHSFGNEQPETRQVLLKLITEDSKNEVDTLIEYPAGSRQAVSKELSSETQNERKEKVFDEQSPEFSIHNKSESANIEANKSLKTEKNIVLDEIISKAQPFKTQFDQTVTENENDETLTGDSQTNANEQSSETENEIVSNEDTAEINIRNLSDSDNISVKEQPETEEVILKVATEHSKNEEKTLDVHPAGSNQTISKEQPSEIQNEQIELVSSEEAAEVNIKNVPDSDHISDRKQPETEDIIVKVDTEHFKNEGNILDEHLAGSNQKISEEQPSEIESEQTKVVSSEETTEVNIQNISDSDHISDKEQPETEEIIVKVDTEHFKNEENVLHERLAGSNQTISKEQPSEVESEQTKVVSSEEAAEVNIQNISDSDHIFDKEQPGTEEVKFKVDTEHFKNEENILDEHSAGSNQTISKEQPSEVENEQIEVVSSEETAEVNIQNISDSDHISDKEQPETEEIIVKVDTEHFKNEENVLHERLAGSNQTISKEQPSEVESEQTKVVSSEETAEVNIQNISDSDHISDKEQYGSEEVIIKVDTEHFKNEENILDEHSAGSNQTISKEQPSEVENEQIEVVSSEETAEVNIQNISDSDYISDKEQPETEEIIVKVDTEHFKNEENVLHERLAGSNQTISKEQPSEVESEQTKVVSSEEAAEVNIQNISDSDHIFDKEQPGTEEVKFKVDTEHFKNEENNLDEHSAGSNQTISKEQPSEVENEQTKVVSSEEAAEVNISDSDHISDKEQPETEEVIVKVDTEQFKNEENILEENFAGFNETISKEQPSEIQNEQIELVSSEEAAEVNIKNIPDSDHIFDKEQPGTAEIIIKIDTEHFKNEENILDEHSAGSNQTISKEQPSEVENEQIEVVSSEEAAEVNIQNIPDSDHISDKEQPETEEVIIKVDTEHFKNEENILDEHSAGSNQTISKEQPSEVENEQIEVVSSEETAEVNILNISDSDHISDKEQPETEEIIVKVDTEHFKNEENVLDKRLAGSNQTISKEQPSEVESEQIEVVSSEEAAKVNIQNISDSDHISDKEQPETEEVIVKVDTEQFKNEENILEEHFARSNQTISKEQPSEIQNEQIELVSSEEAAEINIKNIPDSDHISDKQQPETEDIIVKVDTEHFKNEENILDEHSAGSTQTISKEQPSQVENEQIEVVSSEEAPEVNIQNISDSDHISDKQQPETEDIIVKVDTEHFKNEENILNEHSAGSNQTIFKEQPSEVENEQIEVVSSEETAEVNIQSISDSDHISDKEQPAEEVIAKVDTEHFKNEENISEEHFAGSNQTISKEQPTEKENEQIELVKSEEKTEVNIQNISDSDHISDKEQPDTEDIIVKVDTEHLKNEENILNEHSAGSNQAISKEQPSEVENEQIKVVSSEKTAEVNIQNISDSDHISDKEQPETEEIIAKVDTEHFKNEGNFLDEHSAGSNQTISKEQPSEVENEQIEVVSSEKTAEVYIQNISNSDHISDKEQPETEEIIAKVDTEHFKNEGNFLDEHSAGSNQTISKEQPSEIENEQIKVVSSEETAEVNIQNISDSDHISDKQQPEIGEIKVKVDTDHFKNKENILEEHFAGSNQTISEEQPSAVESEQTTVVLSEEAAEVNIQNISDFDHISDKEQPEIEEIKVKVDTEHFKNEENVFDERLAGSNQTNSKEQPSEAQNIKIEVVSSEETAEINIQNISDSDHISDKEQPEMEEVIVKVDTERFINEENILDEHSAGPNQTISKKQPSEIHREQEAAQDNIPNKSSSDHISTIEQLEIEEVILIIDTEHSKNKEDNLDQHLEGSSQTISEEPTSEINRDKSDSRIGEPIKSLQTVENAILDEINPIAQPFKTQSEQTVTNNPPNEYPKEEETSDEKFTAGTRTISKDNPSQTVGRLKTQSIELDELNSKQYLYEEQTEQSFESQAEQCKINSGEETCSEELLDELSSEADEHLQKNNTVTQERLSILDSKVQAVPEKKQCSHIKQHVICSSDDTESSKLDLSSESNEINDMPEIIDEHKFYPNKESIIQAPNENPSKDNVELTETMDSFSTVNNDIVVVDVSINEESSKSSSEDYNCKIPDMATFSESLSANNSLEDKSADDSLQPTTNVDILRSHSVPTILLETKTNLYSELESENVTLTADVQDPLTKKHTLEDQASSPDTPTVTRQVTVLETGNGKNLTEDNDNKATDLLESDINPASGNPNFPKKLQRQCRVVDTTPSFEDVSPPSMTQTLPPSSSNTLADLCQKLINDKHLLTALSNRRRRTLLMHRFLSTLELSQSDEDSVEEANKFHTEVHVTENPVVYESLTHSCDHASVHDDYSDSSVLHINNLNKISYNFINTILFSDQLSYDSNPYDGSGPSTVEEYIDIDIENEERDFLTLNLNNKSTTNTTLTANTNTNATATSSSKSNNKSTKDYNHKQSVTNMSGYVTTTPSNQRHPNNLKISAVENKDTPLKNTREFRGERLKRKRHKIMSYKDGKCSSGDTYIDVDVGVNNDNIGEHVDGVNKDEDNDDDDFVAIFRHFVPGSIAEREYKKWYNAVEMPNNPYAPEALKRRISGSQERVIDLPKISPTNDLSSVDLINEPKLHADENTKLENDYKRYSRDYYINSSIRSPHMSPGRDVPPPAIKDNREPTTKTTSSTEIETKMDLYKAIPAQVIETNSSSMEAMSTLSTEVQPSFTSLSEDSDTLKINDAGKQQDSSAVIKDIAAAKRRDQGAFDTLDSEERPTCSTTRGSTPVAFKFLQPKRKLLEPNQVLTVDEEGPQTASSLLEKPVIEEEVVKALPSVKALARAFLLTTNTGQPEKLWLRKARTLSQGGRKRPTPSKTPSDQYMQSDRLRPEDDVTITSELSSLETDSSSVGTELATTSNLTASSTNDPSSPTAAGNISPVVVRQGVLKNNIAFFENLKNK